MKLVVCVAILPLLFFADGLNLPSKKSLKALDQQEEIFRSSNKMEDIENRETIKEKDRGDSFMLKSALTKQVEDELENEHRLSPSEIKLLEFFINFIKHEKTNYVSSDIAFHKPKKIEDDFYKRHTNEGEKKSVDVKTIITKSVDDKLKSLLHHLVNKRASEHKVKAFEKVQVDPKANTENEVTQPENEVTQPENEATTERKKEINRFMDKLVRNYVTSIKKQQEEVKHGKNNILRKRILSNILSLVTKEHKGLWENTNQHAALTEKDTKEVDRSQEVSHEEISTNNNRMKDKNEIHQFLMNVDPEFAKEFWKRLGVEKEEDVNADENNKRASAHCIRYPKTECKNVCLKSLCQELCLGTSKELCTSI